MHFVRPPITLLLSPSLSAAKHVYIYVRRDRTKGPLKRPYSGPYAVLTPGNKTCLTDIGGRAESISVDRIKPGIHLNQSCWLNLLHMVTLQPNRVISRAVIDQTQAPPLSISKPCQTLLFRRHREQAVLFDHLCDTSDSYGVSLWGRGEGALCGVWTAKSWTIILTYP